MMYGLVRDSATVGLAKRAARPVRRASRRKGRANQMSWVEIFEEFANAGRVLRARWQEREAGR